MAVFGRLPTERTCKQLDHRGVERRNVVGLAACGRALINDAGRVSFLGFMIRIRHPPFTGLREDKPAHSVKREEPA